MINWLIEVSLRNRILVIALFGLLAGWGYWALAHHADRRDPRSVGQPGDRLHRLAGAVAPGGGGPDHVPAHGKPAGAAGRARGPVLLRLRVLDDQRHLRGRRGRVFRALACPRVGAQWSCRAPPSRPSATSTSSTCPSKARRGKFVQRVVRLGAPVGDAYTVLGGLKPDEIVVTDGSFFLRAESLKSAPPG